MTAPDEASAPRETAAEKMVEYFNARIEHNRRAAEIYRASTRPEMVADLIEHHETLVDFYTEARDALLARARETPR